ncbi:glycoside hydrolase family 6 protein [Dactylosporangium sp. CS-033363]|uniref:glycoside hydrolase family 6 protein n=1 Tax=Dactylosporangium sp. CS-033363 TaxID=3239935 RepID=UPI003D9226C3
MRRKLAIVSIAAVAATGGAIAVMQPASAATGCSVKYTVTNQWPGGFGASVELTNTGDALTSWNIGWDFVAGQGIQQMWSAVPTVSGLHVTAKNESYNGAVPAGGKVSFGFNGTWTTANPVPGAFTLNGAACNGGTTANQAPSVSLTSPAAGASFTAPATVAIAANASDADGTIAKVEFYNGSTLLGTDTSAPYAFSWTGVAAGTYSVTAKAYDNAGLSTASTAVPVTVTAGGGTGAPSVALTSPTAGSSFTAPATVALAATASDSDGTVAKVDFYNGTTLLGTDTSAPYTWSWTGVAAGSYTVSAKATDNAGNSTSSSGTAITVTSGTSTPDTHVDNPYVGAKGYVNADWSTKAAAEPGGSKIAGTSTAIWIDRIAAIAGSSSSKGVREHLDAALAQAAGGVPVVVQFVVYDLPNRDCAALASNGELKVKENGLARYKSEFIDPIAAIMTDAKYNSLRIVNVVEDDSLPNLVTNLGIANCAEANTSGAYVQGIQYALNKLHKANIYNYLDIGHHAWLGWDSNFGPAVTLLANTVKGTTAGFNSVDGFISNTANYSSLTEPYFTVNTQVGGNTIRQSKWVDWNMYVDELSFTQAFRNALVTAGFPATLGMLIDTSRNGWGGTARPAGPSTSTDVNTFVNTSRIDRRIHAGNWCNQSGAGMGERPRATPATGIDAYVWIKPPGESDGSSTAISNDEGKGFDRMCDPTYTGNTLNGNNLTGALPGAPISGAWFSAQFQQLMTNAYPAL